MSSQKTNNRRDSGVVVDTRKEDYMKEKKLVKELKEEILELKKSKKEADSRVMDIHSIAIFKEELVKADRFMRLICKDLLMSYEEEIMPMTEISVTEKEVLSKLSKVKEKDEVEMSKLNSTCSCHMCVNQRISIFSKHFKKSMNETVMKEFLICRNIYLKVHYSPLKFTYSNDVRNSDMKTILFKSTKDKMEDIKMDILVRKKDKTEDMSYNFDFSTNNTIDMEISLKMGVKRVSLSSINVVTMMREMYQETNIVELAISEKMEEKREQCFKKMLLDLVGLEIDRDNVLCISDLTIQEETYFLSNCGLKKLFFKMFNGSKNHLMNHISTTWFDGAMEMSSNMLVTTNFRNVSFYNNSDDETEEFDMVEDVLKIEKSLSDQTGDTNKLWATEKRNMTKYEEDLIDSLFPTYHTPFVKERIMEMFKPYLDYSIKVDAETTKESSMAWSLMNIGSNEVGLCKIFNISWREFKALRYFSRSSKDFIQMVTTNDYMELKEKIDYLPEFFLMFFYSPSEIKREMEKHSCGKEFLYVRFLSALDSSELFSEMVYIKMFRMLKLQVLSRIYFLREGKEADAMKNEMYTAWKLGDNKVKEGINFKLVERQSEITKALYEDRDHIKKMGFYNHRVHPKEEFLYEWRMRKEENPDFSDFTEQVQMEERADLTRAITTLKEM